jgi:hypothetical protein
MRFFDSHTGLLYLVYLALALGVYVLIISSICKFLEFGEESDRIRAQWADGSQPVR